MMYFLNLRFLFLPFVRVLDLACEFPLLFSKLWLQLSEDIDRLYYRAIRNGGESYHTQIYAYFCFTWMYRLRNFKLDLNRHIPFVYGLRHRNVFDSAFDFSTLPKLEPTDF